ncbi:sensor histidine kinase [Nonomuraea sp. NPDC003754]
MNRPLLFDVAVAGAVFLAGAGFNAAVYRDPAGPLLLHVALALPLVWRRRAPVSVFCAVCTAAFAQWLAGVQLVTDVALLVAVYTVAARSAWRHTLAAWLVLEAGVVLASVRWAAPYGSFLPSAVFLTAVAAAVTIAGVNARIRAERAARLARERVADERARIAREIHDVVTHNLSVMVALADAAAYAQEGAPATAAAAVRQIAETGRQALTDMRRTLGILRAAEAGHGGATGHGGEAGYAGEAGYGGEAGRRGGTGDGGEAGRGGEEAPPADPMPGIAQLDHLAGQMRAAGLPTRLDLRGDPALVSPGAQLTVFRLVQEALTNTLKHAPPGTRAEVVVDCSPTSVTVEVTDDGHTGGPAHGRAPSRVPSRASGAASGTASGRAPVRAAGHGIIGMRERACAYGGTVAAGPLPGRGWQVRATLDLGTAAP